MALASSGWFCWAVPRMRTAFAISLLLMTPSILTKASLCFRKYSISWSSSFCLAASASRAADTRSEVLANCLSFFALR